jgi:signal peptidase I
MAKSVLGAFVIAILLKLFFFDFMVAEGQSMTPAIKSGKVILVCKILYGLRVPGSVSYVCRWSLPREGDVVVFYTPGGDMAVKRYMKNVDGANFYALGDNGVLSYDSRSYGPVPVNHIIGKVLGIK